MPSPSCQVKDGSGSYQPTTDGVDVTPANTITINLISSAGVRSWTVSCTSTDETNDAETITAGLTIDTVAKTATFTAPAAGSALIFTSVVNGGVDENGIVNASFTTTFGVFTLTATSKRVLALNQEFEGDSTFGWASNVNDMIRSGGGGGSVPTGTGIPHIVGGVQNAAASLVVNADVDAAAAIAGTKVSPDFGAQNITTTGSALLGSTPRASTGLMRFPNATIGARFRNAANSGDLTVWETDSTNKLFFGTNSTFSGNTVPELAFAATSAFQLVLNGATAFYITSAGVGAYQGTNFGIYGGSGSFPAVGGGSGVMGVANAAANPSSNPTGGGILYADSGAGKWRGSSGTVTTFGPADPHCPTCGRDFAVEHQNEDMGEHLALCLPCLVDALKEAGINTKKFSITDKRGASKDAWDKAHAAAKERDLAHAEKLRAASE